MSNPYIHTFISDYLFCTMRDGKCKKSIDDQFNKFIYEELEDAVENDEIDFDVVVMLLQIESFSEWLNNKFIKYIKMDQDFMYNDAYAIMIATFVEPDQFFKILKGK